MAISRPKVLLAVGMGVLLAALTAVAYSLDLPPFKKRGEITATEVCPTLGNAQRAVAALTSVLPEKESYSFDDSVTDPRTDAMDSTYDSSCFVYGDGQQLASVRTEMLEYGTPDEWVKEVVGPFAPQSPVSPFAAGDKAVASSEVAAIYAPCAEHGASRHLSVLVKLKKPGGTSASELRKGLIALAEGAASFAHEKARCELSSKVQVGEG